MNGLYATIRQVAENNVRRQDVLSRGAKTLWEQAETPDVPAAITGIVSQMSQGNQMTTALKQITQAAGAKSARRRGAKTAPAETDNLGDQLAKLGKMTRSLKPSLARHTKALGMDEASTGFILGIPWLQNWLRKKQRPEGYLSLEELKEEVGRTLAEAQ